MSRKASSEFPPHLRRRPLKSKAFDTFLRIVSECHSHFQNQEQVAMIQGDQMVENNYLAIRGDSLLENDKLGTDDGLARENLLVNGDREGDLLVENNDSRAEDGLALQNSLVDENREVVSSQEPACSGDRMDVDGLEIVDNVKSNGDQVPVDNVNGIEQVIEGNQNCNNDFAAFASLIDNDDQFSLPDFDMEESDLGEQLGDNAPCADVSELIDSLLETDATVKASIPLVNNDANSLHAKRNEIETQVGLKESDSPGSASVMVSSPLQKTVEGIEDGEVLKVSGFLEKSSDLLHEDVLPLENSVDKGDLLGDTIHKEGFNPNTLQRGLKKDNQSFSQARTGVQITSTAMNVERGNDNRNLVNNRTQVYYGDTVEDNEEEWEDSRLESGRNRRRSAPKAANSQASCPKNISLRGGLTGENTIENQCSASTEKVANQNNKKRKGGCSEDRKANRKKERMKRAEQLRELGVKKLKLLPVSKPKTVSYCHHFLKGRCHEGDKCKFSHDTVQLTKSKPCCHFAHQSCMKGDYCPFDHQLSKYPCNSFLSQGSCIRGFNRMFSHKVLMKEGSSGASDICNPDLKSVSVTEISVPKKQMNPNFTGSQNSSTNLSSSGVSYCKNYKKNGEGLALKPAGQAPKGISFLLHGKVPLGNISKNGQGPLPNGAKVDQQTLANASNGVESLHKSTQRKPVVPRGVNFLSFGKDPSESCTKKSSFSLVSNVETGKSPLSDPDKSEQADSSSKTDVGVTVDFQTGQGASSTVQNTNETANRTPATTPQGLGLLSAGNLLDRFFNKKQAGSNSNENNAMHPTVRNNESVSDKHRTFDLLLPPVLSSPLPSNHSLSKLTDVQSKGSSSSLQGSLFSNTPKSLQRAFQSTLALAAKFESKAKNAVSTDLSKEGSSNSHNNSMKPSTILDFLYSYKGKSEQ
ncbi:uncharacterized protein LOC108216044 isoform X2 [Daucus carota subsp. sativus]|uniref:uncharacterized protein LOC108216044 isoform X2 n=1 Tax=Daucus carota subsp. sativus TaxID=79200 RepID=UPI003083BFD3